MTMDVSREARSATAPVSELAVALSMNPAPSELRLSGESSSSSQDWLRSAHLPRTSSFLPFHRLGPASAFLLRNLA